MKHSRHTVYENLFHLSEISCLIIKNDSGQQDLLPRAEQNSSHFYEETVAG